MRLLPLFCLFAAVAVAAVTPEELTRAVTDRYGKPDTAETVRDGDDLFLQQFRFREADGTPRSIALIAARPSAALRPVLNRPERTETVSRQLLRRRAAAGINAGYFYYDREARRIRERGVLRIDGKTIEEGAVWGGGCGGYLGIDRQGKVAFGYADDFRPDDFDSTLWVYPLLLVDGEVAPRLPERNHLTLPHPRSAVGVTADGWVLLVAVDGRHPGQAVGMSCRKLAELLKTLGCRQAGNLDGGGSVTLCRATADGGAEVLNHPCDNRKFDRGGERKVSVSLLLVRPDQRKAAGR